MQRGENMKCNLEQVKKEIAALLPSAHPEGGEATLLINAQGKKCLDRRSLRWILKRLASLYNLDLSAVKNNYGRLLGRKRYLPIPLSHKLIYLPLTLKTNTIPLAARLGYISLEEIISIKSSPEAHIIVLQSGLELLCLNTLATIRRRRRDSKLLQKILQSEQLEGKNLYHCAKGSSFAAEKRCSTEEIACFTANFLHFLAKKQ